MRTWAQLVAFVAAAPARSRWTVPRAELPPPAQGGFHESLGLPVGQSEDWRLTLPDCRGVHAQLVGDVWVLHVDQVDPACDLVGHGAVDAPLVLLAGTTALGALLGRLLGGRGRGWKTGALAGAAVGMEVVSRKSRR